MSVELPQRAGAPPTLRPEHGLGLECGSEVLCVVSFGEDQLKAHNGAITTILLALLTQALSNYVELKSLKPRLEDPDLETFLDHVGDRDRLLSGMTKTRNAVFHVKSRRAWRHRDVVFLHDVLRGCEGESPSEGPRFSENGKLALTFFHSPKGPCAPLEPLAPRLCLAGVPNGADPSPIAHYVAVVVDPVR